MPEKSALPMSGNRAGISPESIYGRDVKVVAQDLSVDEDFELSKLAKEYNVPTYTHVRYASNTEPQSSFEAVQQLIANAAITGAHMPQFSILRF